MPKTAEFGHCRLLEDFWPKVQPIVVAHVTKQISFDDFLKTCFENLH